MYISLSLSLSLSISLSLYIYVYVCVYIHICTYYIYIYTYIYIYIYIHTHTCARWLCRGTGAGRQRAVVSRRASSMDVVQGAATGCRGYTAHRGEGERERRMREMKERGRIGVGLPRFKAQQEAERLKLEHQKKMRKAASSTRSTKPLRATE